jgi:hypothetical protein
MKLYKYIFGALVAVVVVLYFSSRQNTQLNASPSTDRNSAGVPLHSGGQIEEEGIHFGNVSEKLRGKKDDFDKYGLKEPDRQDWINNFPYHPTYSDKDFFIPEKYNFPEDFESEYQRDMDHVVRVYRHGFMRYFYENPTRYSRGFEEIYKILESEGLGDNPMAAASIWNDMYSYHRAHEKDPDAIWKEDDVDYDVIELPDGTRTVGLVKKTKTFSDLADDLHEMVVGKFLIDSLWIDQEKISETEARRIRDRLFDEIDAESFLEHRWPTFAYNGTYEQELQAGDPMMIK